MTCPCKQTWILHRALARYILLHDISFAWLLSWVEGHVIFYSFTGCEATVHCFFSMADMVWVIDKKASPGR